MRFSPSRCTGVDRIDGPGPVDRNGRNFAKTHRYTFGVSRSTMKKVYIDEILKKASDLEPGPGVYNLHPSFGPKVGS